MVSLANSVTVARSFLFQRLKWPVPMTRWRAAKEIRNLLNDPVTRSSTTDALLDYLDQCKTESEICEILTIIFLTSPDGRPSHLAIALRIHCPSVLADMILERTYGFGGRIWRWGAAHSGRAPAGFEAGSYFEEHKTAHVPPILASNLGKLERVSGYPFLQQWAYEWKSLRDKLGTYCTRYPDYFDDVLEARAGVTGQYWQRIREVFLSAYLRTLAYAVSEWGLPQRIAEDYCLDMVHGIAGLFELEPGARPGWLSEFPERLCAPSVDFAPLIRELLQTARTGDMRLVSLSTPIASSIHKYANLELSAHLLSNDYQLPDGAILYEKMPLLSVADTFQLEGHAPDITIGEAITMGKSGDEVSVCTCLFPLPFGIWQGDYFRVGLAIPASYTVPEAKIRCSKESIECMSSDGKIVSRTAVWNDDWTSMSPKGGSTRCGSATVIDREVLDKAMVRLQRKLAFFVRLRIWSREKDHEEYTESARTFFLVDCGR